MKDKVLIFGGTTEGRALCEAFSRSGREALVCTATAYGGAVVDAMPHIRVHTERMDADCMARFITAGAFNTVIDCTHPYAEEATRNIREACGISGCAYVRVIRDNQPLAYSAGIRSVPDMEAAVEYLAKTTGNVLLATGSKDLARFCRLPGHRDRLYARVLPDAGVIAACNALGFRGKHIVAMQGPFSHALNLALLRQLGCAFMVTKNTGKAGGLESKISAALEAGAEIILVERPVRESGYTPDEALRLLGLLETAVREKS